MQIRLKEKKQRGMISSVESSCYQMQEPRVKMAAALNLPCSGYRKVHDFFQGQRSSMREKEVLEKGRVRNSQAYREAKS